MPASEKKKHLDLAHISDWMSETFRIIDKLVPKEICDELRSYNPEEMYEDTLSFLVDCGMKHGYFKNGQVIEHQDWAIAFEAAFISRYKKIRAFHSCRTFVGLDSYRKKGIQKLSRNLLRELAQATEALKITLPAINRTALRSFSYYLTASYTPS